MAILISNSPNESRMDPMNPRGRLQAASEYGVPPSGGGAWANPAIGRILTPSENAAAGPAKAGTPYPDLRSSVPRPFPTGRGGRSLLCALLFAAVCLFSVVPRIMADDTPASESQVRAAFVINFPKYADWPPESFADAGSPIVIGILGETPMTDELQKILAGRRVNGRQIVLKRLSDNEVPAVCHILFVSAAAEHQAPNIIGKLKGRSVLTVGETEDFLEKGGIINLVRRDKKIAIEVNLKAAGDARISISSRLLNVAKVVKGRNP